MAGLQGAGKTTSTGKLARVIRETGKKRILVVSCDVYRPAAIEQLKTGGGAGRAPSSSRPRRSRSPLDIARAALDYASKHLYDVLIVDTAGRLHVDDGDDGRDQGPARPAQAHRDPVRGRRHARARTRSTPPRPSTRRCRSPASS